MPASPGLWKIPLGHASLDLAQDLAHSAQYTVTVVGAGCLLLLLFLKDSPRPSEAPLPVLLSRAVRTLILASQQPGFSSPTPMSRVSKSSQRSCWAEISSLPGKTGKSLGVAQRRSWAGSAGPRLGKGPQMIFKNWEAPPTLGCAWPPSPAPVLLQPRQEPTVLMVMRAGAGRMLAIPLLWQAPVPQESE